MPNGGPRNSLVRLVNIGNERERGGGGEREEISVGKIDRSRSLESELEFVIGGRGLRSEAGGTGDGETDTV